MFIEVPACKAPVSRSSTGRFQSINAFRAVDLYVAEVINN